MTDPTLLRRAIESVGIEKPSDYTLVLEELERLMERPRRIWAGEDRTFTKRWRDDPSGGDEYILAEDVSALIRAATDLVQEMEEMGYGKTSDRALPGSWDTLLKALQEVKG